MDAHIQRLVHLQALDMRLSELRSRLQALPAQVAAIDKRITDARQQIAVAKEALTTSLKDRKKYEMDVDSWKEKARKYRDQSFEVKTNEAYKALQHEIQHAEKQVAEAEDRLLERMVAGEEYERQVKAAEHSVIALESEARSRTAKDSGRASLFASKSCRPKRPSAARSPLKFPKICCTPTNSIARRRHGIGVAEVREEACGLCGVRIRPHVFQELRRDDCHEIFQCETCTRILYYVEPPAAAPPDAGSKASAAGISANEA